MRSLGVLLMYVLALAAETGIIEGQLLNGDGTPWAGAEVTAFILGEGTPWQGVAETDKEGRFRIVDLPPGRYVLRYGAKREPRAKQGNPLDEVFRGFIDGIAQMPLGKDHPDAITVEGGQTVRRDIRLPKRARARFVLSHRGKPLPGAKVEVFRVDANNEAGWTVAVGEKRAPRTDREGIASLGEIDEGRYAVEFEIGQWSVYGGVHEVKGSEPHSFPVELGTHSVRVKVLDHRGQPVPTAMVEVSWSEGDWDFVRARDMKEFPSNDGVFLVPYVRPAKIQVRVHGPGDSTGNCDAIDVGPKNPEPEAIVRLDATATLVIRVVDAEGEPVPGVHVRIENADEEEGRPSFGCEVNIRGELRQVVTLRRWRIRIDDFEHGDGEWTIAKPEANEEIVVVLTAPEWR